MDDACLHRRQLPGRVDRVREALQPVADHDAHVLDPTVLDLGEHAEPELRTLTAIAGQDAENVTFPSRGDADSDIERLVTDLPVTDLHHDRVDEHDRVDPIQRPVLPFGHLLDHLVGDLRDRVLAHRGAVDVIEVRCDLTGGQPTGSQREDDLVDPVQPTLPFAHDLGLKRPLTIPRHVDLHGTDLGEHRPGPRPVTGVATIACLVLLIAEVLGHLDLESGLQHRLRQSRKQSSWADQADACSFA